LKSSLACGNRRGEGGELEFEFIIKFRFKFRFKFKDVEEDNLKSKYLGGFSNNSRV